MPQLQPYEPGFVDSARDELASGLLGMGLYSDNPYAAYRAAEGILSVIDFIPGVGDAKGAAETVDAANRGDYATAGLMGAATAAGAVPVLGDAASAVLMGIARKRGIEDVSPSQIYDKRVKAQPNCCKFVVLKIQQPCPCSAAVSAFDPAIRLVKAKLT